MFVKDLFHLLESVAKSYELSVGSTLMLTFGNTSRSCLMSCVVLLPLLLPLLFCCVASMIVGCFTVYTVWAGEAVAAAVISSCSALMVSMSEVAWPRLWVVVHVVVAGLLIVYVSVSISTI